MGFAAVPEILPVTGVSNLAAILAVADILSAWNYRHSFRENKPNTLVFYD